MLPISSLLITAYSQVDPSLQFHLQKPTLKKSVMLYLWYIVLLQFFSYDGIKNR